MMWWLMGDIISYENNVMLAAILSLLLVVLFVLVLHIYAQWFLGRHRASSVSMAQVFGPAHRVRQARTTTTTTTTYDITSFSLSSDHPSNKGLDPTVLDSIPIFVAYDESDGQECAICLSVFEEREKGRRLPRCSHAFHVECIDMWLHSHSNCPVCRAQVVVEADELGQRREKIGDDHHRTVEVEDDDDDHDGNSSTGEIVVENRDGGHENESVTSDYCSLRRMLSLSSRSINRIYPSSLRVVTQV